MTSERMNQAERVHPAPQLPAFTAAALARALYRPDPNVQPGNMCSSGDYSVTLLAGCCERPNLGHSMYRIYELHLLGRPLISISTTPCLGCCQSSYWRLAASYSHLFLCGMPSVYHRHLVSV
jgi:hypothetical protein